MALQTIKGGLWLPNPVHCAVTPDVLGLSLTGVNSRHAVVFQAPKAGNIHKVHLPLQTVTTSTTMTIRVETVDLTTGDPTGTLWATNTSGTFTPSANSMNAVTLTADATVNGNDIVAIVMKSNGGTPLSMLAACLNATTEASKFPYCDRFVSSWLSRQDRPMCVIEYSDGSIGYLPNCFSFATITTNTFNNGSTPDEYAMKFQVPFPCRSTGGMVLVDADGDFDCVLYEGTTVKATVTHDKDVRDKTASAGGDFSFLWPNPGIVLTKNTDYYLAVKPSSATNLSTFDMNFALAAHMDAMDGGQSFLQATRTDAGAWTPDTTKRPFASIILDQIDDGVQIPVPTNYATVS